MPEMTAAETAGEPIYDSLDDIIKALDAMYNSEKFIKKADYWSRCAGEAASILRRVASGELAPVIHAHWIEDTEPADGDIRCSNCGIAWPICVQKYLQHVGVKKWTNFLKICPDCGALMDEPKK